jgi:nucleoside-diphosphate-sugar epimerase
MTKTALVTGAAGFVGRHMARELRTHGYEIHRCDIAGPMAWTMHDVNDMVRWNTNVYDLVVHCAAVGAHRAAIDGQPMTFAQNMKLDAALFEWAIRTRQKRVLYISSSAAYPIAPQNALIAGYEDVRMHEDDINLDDPMLADGTYGMTKLTGEHLARSARQAGVPVTVVRPFSGYGEDQGTDWPFGAFVDRIHRREMPFTIWGSAHQRRDWIHISDVVRGMLAIADAQHEINDPKNDEPVNLCTGQATSMGDLAMLMMNAAGYDKMEIVVDETKPLGVLNRVGDPTRFFEYYEPKVTIEEGVYRTLKTKD